LDEKINAMETFQALWTSEIADGTFETSVHTLPFSMLGEQDVLIRVSYSSLNFKDALDESLLLQHRKTLLQKMLRYYQLHLLLFGELKSPQILHEVFAD
jgi:hypothetical protein